MQRFASIVSSKRLLVANSSKISTNPAINQMPREAHLKSIANGLKEHGVNRDYIQDEILSVPFVPDWSQQNHEDKSQSSEKTYESSPTQTTIDRLLFSVSINKRTLATYN